MTPDQEAQLRRLLSSGADALSGPADAPRAAETAARAQVLSRVRLRHRRRREAVAGLAVVAVIAVSVVAASLAGSSAGRQSVALSPGVGGRPSSPGASAPPSPHPLPNGEGTAQAAHSASPAGASALVPSEVPSAAVGGTVGGLAPPCVRVTVGRSAVPGCRGTFTGGGFATADAGSSQVENNAARAAAPALPSARPAPAPLRVQVGQTITVTLPGGSGPTRSPAVTAGRSGVVRFVAHPVHLADGWWSIDLRAERPGRTSVAATALTVSCCHGAVSWSMTVEVVR